MLKMILQLCLGRVVLVAVVVYEDLAGVGEEIVGRSELGELGAAYLMPQSRSASSLQNQCRSGRFRSRRLCDVSLVILSVDLIVVEPVVEGVVAVAALDRILREDASVRVVMILVAVD